MPLKARLVRSLPAVLPPAITALCGLLMLTAALPGQGRRRPAPVALKVGWIHTVDREPIQNGVILLRGNQIMTIGSADEVVIPGRATVLSYPDAHAWPTMVDAQTTLGLGGASVDRRLDGGTELASAVDVFDPEIGRAGSAGVGHAYISNRSAATWRGTGSILSLRGGSAGISDDNEVAAMALRLTAGANSRHPFERQQLTKEAKKLFQQLDKYEEAAEKYEKDLETYEKDLEKWLEWHRKKNGKDEKKDDPKGDKGKGDGKQGEKKDGDKPTKKDGDEKPKKEKPDGDKPEKQDPDKNGTSSDALLTADQSPQSPRGRRPAPQQKQTPKKDGKAGDKGKGKDDKEPKRPKRPKAPKENPAIEHLQAVLNGELVLRVEAQRRDEVLQAMAWLMKEQVPRVVLEGASAAEELATDLAALGTPVVVTGIGPGPLAESWSEPGQPAPEPARLAATLHNAGVPVAIASGQGSLSRHLPLLAAAAAGAGMPRDAAVRAITLTAAEILGIETTTGSITPGKRADILLTDGHLLDTATMTLRVIREGRTVFRNPAVSHPDDKQGDAKQGRREQGGND